MIKNKDVFCIRLFEAMEKHRKIKQFAHFYIVIHRPFSFI